MPGCALLDQKMGDSLATPSRWSLVHGFAMLLLDDRLKQLIARLPPGVDEMAFLPAILSAAQPKT